MSQQEPSEEELRAALEEQMRRITVPDVLIQTVVTLINLGGRRLGLAGPPEQAGEKDVEQARLAIEGARALLPLLPQDQDLGPVRDALSRLQMAYVQEAEGAGGRGQRLSRRARPLRLLRNRPASPVRKRRSGPRPGRRSGRRRAPDRGGPSGSPGGAALQFRPFAPGRRPARRASDRRDRVRPTDLNRRPFP